jgi:FAD/FMN-containing dehydrogenase
VLVAKFMTCPFAVKSGGHATFRGASNIQDGITIDLNKLNMIQVSNDKKTTRVGAGNRWIDVYSALAPRNLSVVGGRVSDIGVGGLTLGGIFSIKAGQNARLTFKVASRSFLVGVDGHVITSGIMR